MTSEPETSTATHELAHILCTKVNDSTYTIEHLSLLLDMLQEQIVVTDPQGVILATNHAMEQITGYSHDDVKGRTPALWRMEGQATAEQSFWDTLAKEKKPYHGTVRNVRKDGTTYEADLKVQPVFAEDEMVRFFLCIEHDVSDTHALERIHRRVVALTSHNLKTPLAAMRWQIEMLRDGEMGRVSKSQKESTEDILKDITRMVHMVDQWLSVTNLDLGHYTPHHEPLVLEKVVADVLAELQPRIEQEGVSVHFTPDSTPTTVTVDAESIRTIAHTLIFNAVKYNREDSTVDINVTMLPAQTEYAGRTFSEPRAILSVRDTGLGIPAEEQGNVFHQCFHASNISELQASGSGLGLYIARKLVHNLGGTIWFTSSAQGSHFVVALPNNTPTVS